MIIYQSHSLHEGIGDQLACETEALWAKLRVNWRINSNGFWRQLASLSPLVVYQATLNSLVTFYQGSPELRHAFRELYEAMLRETKWLLHKKGSASEQALEDLMQAPHR